MFSRLIQEVSKTFFYILPQIYGSALLPAYFSFTTLKSGYVAISNQNECGGPSLEETYFLKLVGEHNSSSITITLSYSSYSSYDKWMITYYNYKVWSKGISSTCDYNCTSCNSGACQYCGGSCFNQEDVCVTACSSGYKYSNGKCLPYQTNNQCIICNSMCNTCNGPNSNNCLSCLTPYYWDDFNCVTSCSSSQYLNVSNNSCANCDSTCQECSGPSSNSCTSCIAGLMFSYGTCVNRCNSNQYLYSTNNSCLNCDPTCQTCDGPLMNNCLSCNPLNYFWSHFSCVTACSSLQYIITSNGSCGDCDSSCKTCSDSLPSNCESCFPGAYFSEGSCVSSCPSNQYLNTSNLSCSNFDISCQTCSGPFYDNCISCDPNHNYSNGICVFNCQTNQFFNFLTKTCDFCNFNCQTCEGPNSNNCTSCPQGSYFYEDECISSCPSNTFLNASNNSCGLCSNSCSTCFDYSENNCSSCFSSKLLFESQCLAACPSHYYGDTVLNACISCDPICLECNGPSNSNCLICNNQTIYSLKNGSCILDNYCLPNQYFDQIQLLCKNCSSFCSSCTGSNTNNCLSCVGNYFFLDNECYDPVKVNFSLIELQNPNQFELKFWNESKILSTTFFDHLKAAATITICNFNKYLFNYSIESINLTDYKLNFSFSDNIYAKKSQLVIILNDSIDNSIVLMNKNAEILLMPFELCMDEDLYYENQSCHQNILIDYFWISKGKFNEILILFHKPTMITKH